MRLHPLSLVVVFAAGRVLGGLVSFEAVSFPELDEQHPWERGTYCTPERWLQDGIFYDHVDAGECFDPPEGDQDVYTRSLADFDGETAFFFEWRIEVDGDSSEFPWGAPAVVVAGSNGPVAYWFAIARDQVKFVRDSFAVILFVDIVPDMPHTFRVELYGEDLYVWYIDGEIIHSGVPAASYPAHTPRIGWRAASAYLKSTVMLDYLRYGTIPIAGSGDADTNGTVDLDDFYFFHECFSNAAPNTDAGPGCRFADFDFDNDIDLTDFAAFQNALTAP